MSRTISSAQPACATGPRAKMMPAAATAARRKDEPDWVQQWWEPDLWSHFGTCAQLVLDHVLINDRVEIADDRVPGALAVVQIVVWVLATLVVVGYSGLIRRTD